MSPFCGAGGHRRNGGLGWALGATNGGRREWSERAYLWEDERGFT